jgi:hypothetical protein
VRHPLLGQHALGPTIARDPLARSQFAGLGTNRLLDFPDGLHARELDIAPVCPGNMDVRVVEAGNDEPAVQVDDGLTAIPVQQLLAVHGDDVVTA